MTRYLANEVGLLFDGFSIGWLRWLIAAPASRGPAEVVVSPELPGGFVRSLLSFSLFCRCLYVSGPKTCFLSKKNMIFWDFFFFFLGGGSNLFKVPRYFSFGRQRQKNC